MYEVLDKITMKFETLHHFSVVKSCRVSKNNLLEVVQCILCKLNSPHYPLEDLFQEVCF